MLRPNRKLNCSAFQEDGVTAFKDVNGIMGPRGEIYTIQDFLDYWDNNNTEDPVLAGYDTVDDWIEDTIDYMQPAMHPAFDEQGFDKYIDGLVDKCMEFINECGEPTQIVEKMFPGYNWRWCAENEYDPAVERYSIALRRSLHNYLKQFYLCNVTHPVW